MSEISESYTAQDLIENSAQLIDSKSDSCKFCDFATKAQTKGNRDMILKRHIEKFHKTTTETENIKL